jgi:N utilization substance protein A
VAVYSKDPDVDCVGACVGMKGSRVQSIIRELRGEKIDIIEFDDDPIAFAANALSPAKINHVSVLDAEQKQLEVIVDDTQLSLAIGKKGQNVRLAAKLLGWRIDIKSEEEKRQEIESQMAAMALRGAPITSLPGLGAKTLQKLRDHGVETVEQLAQMTPDELTQIEGIGEKTVERIRRVVTDYFEQAQQAMEAPAAAQSLSPAAAEAAAGVQATSHEQPSAGEPVAEDTAAAQAAAEAVAQVQPASQEQASAGEAVPEEAAVPQAEAKAEEPKPSQEGEGEQGTPLPGEGGETG